MRSVDIDSVLTTILTAIVVMFIVGVLGFIIFHAFENAQYATHQQKMACIERAEGDLALMVCKGVR